jgi:hypothetical protein
MADRDEDLCYEGTPISSYRVVDLRAILEKHGLAKSGAKKELAARLSSVSLTRAVIQSPNIPKPERC